MGVFVVVASQFEQFAQQDNVITYDELLEGLRLGSAGSSLIGKKLIAGQGLSSLDMEEAYQTALKLGLSEEFEHWYVWMNSPPAGQQLSHKRKIENVLITVPEQREDGTFVANLLLPAGNELMLDHLTGQHVQGMVLTEACRQMFLAVTERFCLEHYEPKNRYFVINEMNLRYLAFAFPLPAEIRYRVIEQKQKGAGRVYIHAQLEVWQSDQPVSAMEVKFVVMDANVLVQREARLASDAIASQVERLRQGLGIEPRISIAPGARAELLGELSHS
ncbi:AfsA-related hotdog domain-containing protein [Pseudomonas protegens]|uniref:AfsA-related hotdog domain-containing protein n=1 Tax=Pseudomonas protegens TaxID=380021 RepID=UPI00275DC7ED|nr:AfsA-related hotdog domain-containing protein [Pseudomonas protegens]MDP9525301.1 AfsA-related hotdog domain-containing protein [Pseudomonas protegens]